ncbi:MAG: proline dehydrogenase family protein [Methanomicrobiales archaeon]|nr:proline dehydrogenase family protein [Methanomicrobiales archaeon]MDI6876381.1 proline dehydrogenase family protein [Methanomicrobiales archaeon]
MAGTAESWTLPHGERARQWCRERNAQGIRCILDILSGAARTREQSEQTRDAYIACIRGIVESSLDASVSVKLTALGATRDPAIYRSHVASLLRVARDAGVGFEVDMEGRGLVDRTLEIAREAARSGFPLTLALQAYLDRTPGDLAAALEGGIRVRLVKGAYTGDVRDFTEIQQRFRSLFLALQQAGADFSVGTHDPELIAWMLERGRASRQRIEFGFLKGLSDRTKLRLAREGWAVAEYVPFGEHAAAYIARRRRYGAELQALGRAPAP